MKSILYVLKKFLNFLSNIVSNLNINSLLFQAISLVRENIIVYSKLTLKLNKITYRIEHLIDQNSNIRLIKLDY